MTKPSQLVPALTISLLIVGNLIGVGILALPINTGLAGLMPTILGMLVLGGAMFFSALILSEEAVASKQDTFNFPSLYQQYLGTAGKWVAVLTNILILYGLLVAYLTGGATILTNLFDLPQTYKWIVTLGLFVVVTGVTLMNVSLILKYNTFIMITLFVFFIIMVVIGEPHVVVNHYSFADWNFLPVAAPIIVTAFHFHNIIPNICKTLDWNFTLIWKSILAGMIIGLLMNGVWVQVGIGVLPMDSSPNSLLTAFNQNLPATVPMFHIMHSRMFMIAALVFSLLAIMSSYLANGMGLLGFIQDMTENHLHIKNHALVVAVTFIPPLAIALVWPEVFLTAINIVGGVGIVILFGILPCIIFIMKHKTLPRRILGVLMLCLFLFCLAFEIGQETGMLQIKPEIEYWNPDVHHIQIPDVPEVHIPKQ